VKAEPDKRDTWIAGIIQAQAQAKGFTTKSLWKQHQSAEKACKMAQLVHATLQSSNQSGALTKVISPRQEGRQEFHTRYLLEKACLKDAGQHF